MKNIVFLVFLLSTLSLFSQRKNSLPRYNYLPRYKTADFRRISLGVDLVGLKRPLWNGGGTLRIETPTRFRRITKNWNIGFYFTDGSPSRIHAPGLTLPFAIMAFVVGPFEKCGCITSVVTDEVSDWMLSIPEGLTWTPIKKRNFTAGVICNALSCDILFGIKNPDYVPDIGLTANYYPARKFSITGRIGARASVYNSNVSVFANFTLGFDFTGDGSFHRNTY